MTKRCLNCGQRTQRTYCERCWPARRKIRSGWQWGTIRNQVRARDRACVQCGGTDRLEVHHRVPLRDGGSNALDNVELLCRNCHLAQQVAEG